MRAPKPKSISSYRQHRSRRCVVVSGAAAARRTRASKIVQGESSPLSHPRLSPEGADGRGREVGVRSPPCRPSSVPASSRTASASAPPSSARPGRRPRWRRSAASACGGQTCARSPNLRDQPIGVRGRSPAVGRELLLRPGRSQCKSPVATRSRKAVHQQLTRFQAALERLAQRLRGAGRRAVARASTWRTREEILLRRARRELWKAKRPPSSRRSAVACRAAAGREDVPAGVRAGGEGRAQGRE